MLRPRCGATLWAEPPQTLSLYDRDQERSLRWVVPG